MSQPDLHNSIASAPLWRQLAALIYDALLVLALLLLAAVLSTAFVALVFPGLQQQDNSALRNHPLHILYLLACWFAYYAYCWRRGGQTLGMRAWKIRLQNDLGGSLQLTQCLMRFISAGLGLGLLLIPLHPRRRSLQDLCSSTRMVLQLPAQQKPSETAV